MTANNNVINTVTFSNHYLVYLELLLLILLLQHIAAAYKL